MRFKEYYLLETKDVDIFREVFDKYYEKGFFGKLNRNEILEQQRGWFKKFITFIKEKDEVELLSALCSKESKLSREYFSTITGVNVKHKTKEYVINLVHEYIIESKKGIEDENRIRERNL